MLFAFADIVRASAEHIVKLRAHKIVSHKPVPFNGGSAEGGKN